MSERPIRLLLVSGSLAGGGAERVASTLLARLDRRRVAPFLCVLRGPIDYPLPDDVPHRDLGKRGPLFLPRTVARLRQVIREVQPDVVLSMIAFVNFVTGVALWRVRRPLHWVARVGAPLRADGMLRPVLRRLYRGAGTILANSDALAAEVAAEQPDLRDRVVALHNPVDFATIDVAAGPLATDDPPVVLAVGRLSVEKRPDLLLEAFAQARRDRPCQLWLCGDGPLRAALERQASRIGISSAVRLFGQVDNPYRVMRQASVFALTSEFEGLPNALIEAQGLGLPAVATRCGGPTEIVEHGETGFLVPTGDIGAVAGALSQLLDDAALRARMGAAAAVRARARFDASNIVPRLERLVVERAAMTERASKLAGHRC